jgi:hypothetical protein
MTTGISETPPTDATGPAGPEDAMPRRQECTQGGAEARNKLQDTKHNGNGK